MANKALARKIAEQYWRIMVYGTDFVEHGLKSYEERVAQAQIATLTRLAAKFNFTLTPAPPPANLAQAAP